MYTLHEDGSKIPLWTRFMYNPTPGLLLLAMYLHALLVGIFTMLWTHWRYTAPIEYRVIIYCYFFTWVHWYCTFILTNLWLRFRHAVLNYFYSSMSSLLGCSCSLSVVRFITLRKTAFVMFVAWWFQTLIKIQILRLNCLFQFNWKL